MLGLVDRLERRPSGVRLVAGGALVVLGPDARSLSGSPWAWAQGHRGGEPPELDLDAHAAVLALVRELVGGGHLAGVHDAADGLGVALAEMAVRSGVGAEVPAPGADHTWLFATSASRVLACVDTASLDHVLAAAATAGVATSVIGAAGGDRLRVGTLVDLALRDAIDAWQHRLPDALGAGTAH
jgi:phosphoribosylformylglycinamidine synthase